jgi:hypothetical protein
VLILMHFDPVKDKIPLKKQAIFGMTRMEAVLPLKYGRTLTDF